MLNEAQSRDAATHSCHNDTDRREAVQTSRRGLLLGGSLVSLGAAVGLGLPLGGGSSGLTSTASAQGAPTSGAAPKGASAL